MTKTRILVFLSTTIVVGLLGIFVSYYARGYRFDTKTLSFTPRGILVVNSNPKGAQIIINGALVSATDATLRLSPGTYDLKIEKSGYIPWQKRIVMEKEVVTQIDAGLFPSVPSLSAVTLSGAFGPVTSPDFSKIAYAVPDNGLWIIETTNLPIGFNREPKQVTDGDLGGSTWHFSPNGREIMLETAQKGVYVLPAGEFTPQAKRVNVFTQKSHILSAWKQEENKKIEAKLAKLPDPLEKIISKDAVNIVFSPDENKILYEASVSAVVPENLIKPIPGASSQKQERALIPGSVYVYDIKEDRNFKVASGKDPIYWLPTSAHLIAPAIDKVVIMDYDGTNKQEVYSGQYTYPYSYPYGNQDSLVILTNLGATDKVENLYTINLK